MLDAIILFASPCFVFRLPIDAFPLSSLPTGHAYTMHMIMPALFIASFYYYRDITMFSSTHSKFPPTAMLATR